MFSANQNLALRKHKRRVVELVEECIPEDALEAGTCVMVMEKTCNAPGCVPLETAIAIVFPRSERMIIEGLEESAGGSYKTNVLKPLADVTRDDILDAMPIELGGRRDPVRVALNARDSMFGTIQQSIPDEDKDGRKLLAEYLIQSLKEYVEHGCIAPQLGEPFPEIDRDTEKSKEAPPLKLERVDSQKMSSSDQMMDIKHEGNFVFQRVIESNEEPSRTNLTMSKTTTETLNEIKPSNNGLNSGLAWRQQQKMNVLGSNSIIQQIYEREHAPGVRRPGCPCCDPDDPSNIVDKMMML